MTNASTQEERQRKRYQKSLEVEFCTDEPVRERGIAVTLKQELQAVMRQLIGTAASSIFLEKCVSAIHESADDRASLLAGATKARKDWQARRPENVNGEQSNA